MEVRLTTDTVESCTVVNAFRTMKHCGNAREFAVPDVAKFSKLIHQPNFRYVRVVYPTQFRRSPVLAMNSYTLRAARIQVELDG